MSSEKHEYIVVCRDVDNEVVNIKLQASSDDEAWEEVRKMNVYNTKLFSEVIHDSELAQLTS